MIMKVGILERILYGKNIIKSARIWVLCMEEMMKQQNNRQLN